MLSARRIIRRCLVIVALFAVWPAASQSVAQGTIPVILSIEGELSPDRAKGPDGTPFVERVGFLEGSVPRPASGAKYYNLEVVYDDHSYPLTIRVNRATSEVRIPISIERPKSCSDFYLEKRERISSTQSNALRDALTLGFMIETRSGTDSCDARLYRAARARFDRYYDAMVASDFIVIPKSIEEALLASARIGGHLTQAQVRIERGRSEGSKRYAVVIQRNIENAETIEGKLLQSLLLKEALEDLRFKEPITSVISEDVIIKQVKDFELKTDVAGATG